jgi:hypothetical protein
MTAQAVRAGRTADRGRAIGWMDKSSPAAEQFHRHLRSSFADDNGIGIIENCSAPACVTGIQRK